MFTAERQSRDAREEDRYWVGAHEKVTDCNPQWGLDEAMHVHGWKSSLDERSQGIFDRGGAMGSDDGSREHVGWYLVE